MKCKYCQTELETNSSVCPKCGKDNLKDNLMPLKIVALSLTCVVMLVLLAGMVHYGVTGSFLPNWATKDPTASTGTTEPTMSAEELKAAMDTVVVTMGDHKLTNRQLQLYYWMSVYTYADSHKELDLTADLDTVIHDEATGQSVEDYCLEEAFKAWQEVTLMSAAAKDAEYKLPANAQAELDGMKADMEQYVYMYSVYYGYDISTVDELVQMQFGAGCDYDTYFAYAKDYYMGAFYWADMVLELEVTDEQINAYFAENAEKLEKDMGIDKEFGDLADYRNILIAVEGTVVENEDGTKSTVITEEDWAECLQKAQALYDQWLAGDATEDTFAELVAENSKDDTTKGNGGLYEDQFKGSAAEVDVRHILIFPEGATSSTVTSKEWPQEAWDYAEKKAQEILDEYLAGEQTEAAFGELAKTHSADGNASKGGLYEDVEYGYMVEAFNDWCFDESREPGNTGIVKTEFGYHVMYFVRADNEADRWLFAEGREPGNSTIVKTDDGYEILYFVTSEPAWYRYSRYGVQGDLGEEMLEELKKTNSYTVDHDKIVITDVNS